MAADEMLMVRWFDLKADLRKRLESKLIDMGRDQEENRVSLRETIDMERDEEDTRVSLREIVILEREDEVQEQTSLDHFGGGNRHLVPSLANNTNIILVAKSFKYQILMLIAVLQANSNIESPFKTHPVQMWVFVVATIIYCHAYQLSNAPVAVIFGSLSTVSLVSIFLPGSLGFLIFIPWSFVPIIVAYQPIHAMFNNIRTACLRLQKMIMDFISKPTRSDSSEQEQPRPRASP
ncbi:hypothetical protein Dsin_026389 [Dipteronia sinensis]|uniref:Uncharacterized protein n=1 Tax=Dipteronia sinensis TaxID=43782 RepID=A0AAE0DZ84_9ROSI|nr:hypothetical protein Dsin_026389 [Dipteronia sinensis]